MHFWSKRCRLSRLTVFPSTDTSGTVSYTHLASDSGLVNKLYTAITGSLPLNWIAKYPFQIILFATVMVSFAYGTTIFSSAIKSIPENQFKAARVDGASKWQKLVNIDIPMLLPTATIMFILRTGSIMSVGFEKVYLLQNTLNSSASEIISTYVYKMGLVSSQYSLSAAIGLFNNIINLVLLLSVNYISKKMSDTSLV